MMKQFVIIGIISQRFIVCNGFLPAAISSLDRTSSSVFPASTVDRTVMEGPNKVFLPERQKYPVELIIEGDTVKDQWWQQLLLTTHFSLVFANLFQVGLQVATAGIQSQLFTIPLAVVLATVVGDFATGVFHWAVDNYGSLQTPIFGPICVAFQGHHQSPWTITFRPFANNVYKIAIATIPLLLLLTTISGIPAGWKIFSVLFLNNWLLSQELHKYAHMRKEQIPNWIQWLQQRNLILSRREHGLHHLSPHEGHYCIVNGMNNKWIDSTEFFRYLEKIVFLLTGRVIILLIITNSGNILVIGNKPINWSQDPRLETIAMNKSLFPFKL